MKRSVAANGIRINYTLIQAHRSGILLQALPEGEFRVYAPKTMGLREVDRLVIANLEKILEMKNKVAVQEQIRKDEHPVGEGAQIYVEGSPRTLHLSAGRTHMEITPTELRLTVPDGSSPDKVRGILKSQLAEYMLPVLRERLDYWSPHVGVTYGRVTVRDQRTRWGSCSSKHNLNFNWKLIMAPREALDYVVVHELCHLHEFSHSPRFWSLVEQHIPDYKVWLKWLKVHGGDLGV